MQFEFATATRIVFGEGSFKRIGSLAREMGSRAFVTCGLDLQRGEAIREALVSVEGGERLIPSSRRAYHGSCLPGNGVGAAGRL